jgi:hypothetical protein
MKKLLTIACVGILSTGATLAHADAKISGFYAGGGLNLVQNYDSTGDDPQNFVLTGGYTFDNGIGVELQFSDSYKAANDNETTFHTYLNTEAAFATYRTDAMVYGKVKAGYLRAEFVNDYVDTYQTGFAGAIGLGVRIGTSSSVEFEYMGTRDTIGLDFYTLSYLYTF